jgi:hypothetical protein
MWKWAHRPDLRDFAGENLQRKELAAAKDPKEAESLDQERRQNQTWMSEADPEEISERLMRMLKNSAYKLPNGYLSAHYFALFNTHL